jgi:hypothetical protein
MKKVNLSSTWEGTQFCEQGTRFKSYKKRIILCCFIEWFCHTELIFVSISVVHRIRESVFRSDFSGAIRNRYSIWTGLFCPRHFAVHCLPCTFLGSVVKSLKESDHRRSYSRASPGRCPGFHQNVLVFLGVSLG